MIETTLLFLGSVIGAGFATGAEIITFFGGLHLPIWLISIIVGMTMFTVIILEIYLTYPHKQQTKLVLPQYQTKMAKTLDFGLIAIYFILFTAMTAGITQITNIGICIFALIISICVVLFGFNSLTRLNSYIVFMIIVLIVMTAIPHILFTPTIVLHWHQLPSGIFWAFLYAGLNCFMFPELIVASAKRYSRRTLISAGAMTAILVTILVDLILSTIQNTNSQNAAIPLLAASPNAITMIVILLAVLTSQYAALFAILQRCQKLFPRIKNRPCYSMVGICLFAFAGSFCGFNQIVNFAYPIIGAITCVFLLFSWVKTWWLR